MNWCLSAPSDMQNEQAEQKVAAHAVPLHEFLVQPVLRRDPARLLADGLDGSDHGQRNQVPDLHGRRRPGRLRGHGPGAAQPRASLPAAGREDMANSTTAPREPGGECAERMAQPESGMSTIAA